jgi:SNF2 family DNA or RNA helicase
MKCRLEGKYLYIDPEEECISAPFLGRSSGGLYKIYWHFIKDLMERYDAELDDEFLVKLEALVDDRDKNLHIIDDPEYRVNPEYETYLDGSFRPYDFQSRGAEFIVKQLRVLLADDVGLGKSVMAILAILDILWKGLGEKFVIVVPASLRLQWLGELRKFVNRNMFTDLRFILIKAGEVGSKKNRMRLYKEFKESMSPVIMIMSYATVVRDEVKLVDLNPNMVVLDEAQKIKNRNTKTNEAIRKLFSKVKYKLALTATPVENGLEDLYSICEWLERRRLRTKTYMLDRYCIVEDNKIWKGRGNFIIVKNITGYRNTDDMIQKLTGLYVRRTVQDVALELPKVIHQNIILDMDKEQVDVYKEIKGEIYGSLSKIDMISQLTLLQECCNATETLDRPGRGGAKLRELKRLLTEDFKYQKVVCITKYEKFAKHLNKGLLKGKNKVKSSLITGSTPQEKRGLIVDDFIGSEGQKILIGTTAIQEGLNLQAGSVLINLDLPWNPASLWQRIGRIYRLGSEYDTIRIVNFIMGGTIEERVMEVLYEKGLLFEKMFSKDEDVKIGNLLDMNNDDLKGMV